MKSTPADKNLLLCKLVNTFLMRHNKWQADGQPGPSYEETCAPKTLPEPPTWSHTHILTQFLGLAFEMFCLRRHKSEAES